MGEGVARTSGWRCASLSCISAHFPKRFWRFFEYFFLFVMGHFFCCHVAFIPNSGSRKFVKACLYFCTKA
jgi:hypothetical protein